MAARRGRAPVLVRSDYETKRSEASAPTKTAASRAVHIAIQRARREETPVHYPCNYGGVVRARPDYRETQRATSVRPIGGTSIKSRKPLIGVDVHARCRVESVRHVSSSRWRSRATSCFSRRARGDPDPAAPFASSAFVRFLFFLISSLVCFFFLQGAARSKAHDLERGGMHAAKRVLITMTRSKKTAGILSVN